MPGDDEFLLTPQLAKRWRKSVPAIHQQLYRGDGPKAYKLGKELRFKLSDVIAYEESKVVDPRPVV